MSALTSATTTTTAQTTTAATTTTAQTTAYAMAQTLASTTFSQTAVTQTAPLVRPAPERGTLAHPSMREPEARYEAFTYYLRERARLSGPQTLAGVTGRAWACPVAVWLLHGDVRGGWSDGRMGVYRWVIVRAGDTTTGAQWPFGRRATYQAFDRRGAKLGLGLCDAQLTAALDWLDAAFPLHTSVTVGECLAALATMEREQEATR